MRILVINVAKRSPRPHHKEIDMNTEVMNVKGMTCGGCTSAVTRALKATGGVHDIAVDLGAGKVTVSYDAGAASPEQLRRAVRSAGFEVVEQASEVKRDGGCCGGCG